MACADHIFINYIFINKIIDTAENIQSNNNKKIIIKLKLRLKIENISIF